MTKSERSEKQAAAIRHVVFRLGPATPTTITCAAAAIMAGPVSLLEVRRNLVANSLLYRERDGEWLWIGNGVPLNPAAADRWTRFR